MKGRPHFVPWTWAKRRRGKACVVTSSPAERTSNFPFFPPPPPPATFRKSVVPHARVGEEGGGGEIPDRPFCCWRPFNYLFVFSLTSTSPPMSPPCSEREEERETGKNCRLPRPRLVRQRKEKKKDNCLVSDGVAGKGMGREWGMSVERRTRTGCAHWSAAVGSKLSTFFGGVFRTCWKKYSKLSKQIWQLLSTPLFFANSACYA